MIAGIGALEPGDGRTLTDMEIYKSDFVVIRERWKDLNPTKGRFEFAVPLEQIKRVTKAGKPFVFGVMTGHGCTPDWVEGKRFSYMFESRRYTNVLAPWESSIPDAYDRLMQRLWSVMAPDALWITGPTVASQEMHTNGIDKQKGWNASKVGLNWMECFDAIRTQFNTQPKILSVSGQKPVQAYMWDVIRYCQNMSTVSTMLFQHNSLGPQTKRGSTHHATLLKLHAQGWKVGYELVQPGASTAVGKFPEASYGVWYPIDIRGRKV